MSASMQSMNSVAIVGGGITGLTAAYRLKEQGIRVKVFEATDRVGGVIRSVRRDGYLAEFGPNTILETSPKVKQLISDLGLENRRVYSNPAAEKRFIAREGRPVEVPSSPLSFLTADLFSWRAKAKLLAEPFVSRGAAEEENLEQFVLRRLGREFLDYAINPLVAGIYAGNPAKLSVKHAFPKIHALEQQYGSLLRGQVLGARERKKRNEVSKQSARKFSFDFGLQVLIDALAAALKPELSFNSPVTAIQQTDEGWRVRTVGGSEMFDAVLFTAPAHKLGKLTVSAAADVSFSRFGEIYYPPVTSLVFGFRRSDVAHSLDGFGVLVPEVEKLNILGAIFSSSLFPNRAPADHVAITVYMGGARNPELATADRSTLRRLALQDLSRLLGVKGQPTFEHYATFRHAIPQYEVGYGQYKTMMSNMEEQLPGVFFAGHFRDGVSLSDSIASAENVAHRVNASIKQASKEETLFAA